VLLAVTIAPASGAPVRGLYEAAVAVPDQSVQAREQALSEALLSVLIRVTGNRELALEPAAQPVLARATALVVGYGYETSPAGASLLRARFDPRAVETALRRQGLPVWGSNRPTHLLWLAVQDGRTRQLVDQQSAPSRAAGILATAESRGLLVTFPAMDSADQQLVSFFEVWEGRYDGLVGASRRYPSDQIVTARAYREGPQWTARWALLDGGGVTEQWNSSGESLDRALGEGLHLLADRQARQFAVLSTGSAGDLVLEISGVRSLQDYSRVLHYLRALNAVSAAHVERLDSETLVCRIEVQGNPDVVLRAIASGRTLRRQPERERVFSSALSYDLVR
jgi:uncharacterized protein